MFWRKRSEQIWQEPQILQLYYEFGNRKGREWKCRREDFVEYWDVLTCLRPLHGWLLCKRSHPHETTQWQRRDWVILILWTKPDWGEFHPSSVFSSRALLALLGMPGMPGNCQLLLISCFEEVRMEFLLETFLLKCSRSYDARGQSYTRCEIHRQWIWLIGYDLKILLHI